MKYIVSVDLGKEQDYTAITVSEVITLDKFVRNMADLHFGTPGRHQFDSVLRCSYMERPVLGTPYADVIGRVKAVCNRIPVKDDHVLLVDKTGVGNPVVEWLEREGLKPLPITITGGNTMTAHDTGGFGVPKVDIAMAMRVATNEGRFKVVKGLGMRKGRNGEMEGEDLSAAYVKEASAFVEKITKSGNASYEAWRERDHDDIIMSLGMAVWWFLRESPFRLQLAEEVPEEPWNPKKRLRTVAEERKGARK